MEERGNQADARQAVIGRLAAPVATNSLPFIELRAVLAFRVLALCGGAGRDPLVELGQRLGSLTAAKAFIAFAGKVSSYWPEPLVLTRPCCRVLTHDELTLAWLVRSAIRGDRTGFSRVLDGLLRSERHEALFTFAVAAVAEADLDGWFG